MKKRNICPVAFVPIARPGAVEKGDPYAPKDWPDLRNLPLLQEIAAKYSKTVVQVMLNWGLCRGHAVIPKATSLKYQRENMDVFDFKLSDEEVQQINQLNTNRRLCNLFLGDRIDFFA